MGEFAGVLDVDGFLGAGILVAWSVDVGVVGFVCRGFICFLGCKNAKWVGFIRIEFGRIAWRLVWFCASSRWDMHESFIILHHGRF